MRFLQFFGVWGEEDKGVFGVWCLGDIDFLVFGVFW